MVLHLGGRKSYPDGMNRLRVVVCALTVWLAASCLPAQPLEQPLNLPPDYPAAPTDGIFLSDRAIVLSIEEVKTINKAAAEIKEATGVSVMVVTIRSVEFMGGSVKVGIEEYARGLVNNWNAANPRGQKDVLLLWARDDERAWVQLGSAWPKTQEVSARAITESVIMPLMKQGSYGQGLLAGVKSLGGMVTREFGAQPAAASGAAAPASAAPVEEPPPPATSNLMWLIPVGACAALVVVVAMVRIMARRSAGQGEGISDDYR